jgi:hypothetical protein
MQIVARYLPTGIIQIHQKPPGRIHRTQDDAFLAPVVNVRPPSATILLNGDPYYMHKQMAGSPPLSCRCQDLGRV